MATRAGETVWTSTKLRLWMADAFRGRQLDSPMRLAEMLLAHVLGCDRLKLYTDGERPASALERDRLRELVARALRHEPVQYLVGEEIFYGLPMKVDRRVLIPRPCTQVIVEAVLDHARGNPETRGVRASDAGVGLLLADVCTGSGAIAVALAKHLPGARLVATDLSEDALDVARENATRHGVADRVDFEHGDLLAALDAHPVARGAGSLTYLCSNPPYIPDDEWAAVEPNVKDHEPTIALRGGVDGLDFVRPLITHGPERLAPGGLLLIEVAAARTAEAVALAERHPMLEAVRVLRDGEGFDRVLRARRRG